MSGLYGKSVLAAQMAKLGNLCCESEPVSGRGNGIQFVVIDEWAEEDAPEFIADISMTDVEAQMKELDRAAVQRAMNSLPESMSDEPRDPLNRAERRARKSVLRKLNKR